MDKSKQQKEQEFKEFIIMERISQLLEERQRELWDREKTMKENYENHEYDEYKEKKGNHEYKEKKENRVNKEIYENNEEEIPAEWMEEQGQREMYLYEKGVEDGIKIMKKVMDCVSGVSRETML